MIGGEPDVEDGKLVALGGWRRERIEVRMGIVSRQSGDRPSGRFAREGAWEFGDTAIFCDESFV